MGPQHTSEDTPQLLSDPDTPDTEDTHMADMDMAAMEDTDMVSDPDTMVDKDMEDMDMDTHMVDTDTDTAVASSRCFTLLSSVFVLQRLEELFGKQGQHFFHWNFKEVIPL